MKFRLIRTDHTADQHGNVAVSGTITQLNIDAGYHAFTLERQAVIIPASTYDVALTHSDRAKRGELWSPFDDPTSALSALTQYHHYLPELLHVPDRTGVRMHALNEPAQSMGCIGVGRLHTLTSIQQSRLALEELCRVLANADRLNDTVQVEILEAFASVKNLTPDPRTHVV